MHGAQLTATAGPRAYAAENHRVGKTRRRSIYSVDILTRDASQPADIRTRDASQPK